VAGEDHRGLAESRGQVGRIGLRSAVSLKASECSPNWSLKHSHVRRSPSFVRLDSRLHRVLHCADESSRGRPCACPFAFIGSGPRRSPYRSIRSGLPASSAELAHPPANARHDRQSQPRCPQACARTVAGRALRTPSRYGAGPSPVGAAAPTVQCNSREGLRVGLPRVVLQRPSRIEPVALLRDEPAVPRRSRRFARTRFVMPLAASKRNRSCISAPRDDNRWSPPPPAS
jgi:hypothetical protein